MRIKEVQDKIIIFHNNNFFILKELNSDRYRIDNVSWNYGYVHDGEYGIMLYKGEIYWWYTEEGGISIKALIDYDNFASYLSKLLPQDNKYFYLIVASLKQIKIVMLPVFLLDDFSSSSILIN